MAPMITVETDTTVTEDGDGNGGAGREAVTQVHSDRTNTLAIVTFALALSGFTIIAQIAGIITGHMALRQLRTSGERGHELAKWGLIISYVVVGIGLLVIVFMALAWLIMIIATLSAFSAFDPNEFGMMDPYEYN